MASTGGCCRLAVEVLPSLPFGHKSSQCRRPRRPSPSSPLAGWGEARPSSVGPLASLCGLPFLPGLSLSTHPPPRFSPPAARPGPGPGPGSARGLPVPGGRASRPIPPCTHARRQPGKQANRQTGKQAGRQIGRQGEGGHGQHRTIIVMAGVRAGCACDGLAGCQDTGGAEWLAGWLFSSLLVDNDWVR